MAAKAKLVRRFHRCPVGIVAKFHACLFLVFVVLLGCGEQKDARLAPTSQNSKLPSLGAEDLRAMFRARASQAEWNSFESNISSSDSEARTKARMMVLNKLTIEELQRAGITEIGTGEQKQWSVAGYDLSDEESARAYDTVIRQSAVPDFAVSSHGTIGFYVPRADFARVQIALLTAQQTQKLRLRVYGPRFDP